jgi:Flp pilus assembly protein TadG
VRVTGRRTSQTHPRRRRSTGQALVEFALITPVFFLTFFGIVEMALILSSLGSYSFAAREGARVGSVFGRTNPLVDGMVNAAIVSRVQGLVMAKANQIDIYRANPFDGTCYTVTNASVAVDNAGCMRDTYTISGTTITPQCVASSDPTTSAGCCTTKTGTCTWWPTLRNDALANADYLGVRVKYQYTFLTAFVSTTGGTISLSTYSVQRIEPQDYNGGQVPGSMAARGSPPGTAFMPAAALVVWKPDDEGGVA